MDEIALRPGDESDIPIVLALFDEAIEWLVARGRSAQWGSAPFTGNPQREEFVHEVVTGGELYVAESAGRPIGVLVLGNGRPYTPPVDEPEVYIDLLLSSRRHRGAGVGTVLIEFAREQARQRGITLLRVDCWSGGDRKLVAYYESQGFVPTVEVPVRDTTAQIFAQRV